MRVRRIINQLLEPIGYSVIKCRDFPSFVSRTVFEAATGSAGPTSVIFDVGANVGQSAICFAKEHPQAAVYAFEPFGSTFEALRANVASQPSVRPFKLAAGSECAKRNITHAAESCSQVNSFAHQKLAQSGSTAVEEIEFVTLDWFCSQHGITSVDILKTDTEGYDLEVLRGASGLLSEGRIKAIVCEVGFDKDKWHTPFSQVMPFLREYGYELTGFYEPDHQPDGRFSHTNAYFASRRNGR